MSTSLPPRATALLLALVLALLVLRLGAVPLLGPDEPRYARVAVEMQRAGAWVRPTLQGEPWLEKPPLYYWLAGGAFRLLGETEAAARLPSIAALLLLTGATALFGARLYGSAAGLHAGFVAGTALLPFAYGRAASMDMLLAATVTLAIGLAGLRLVGIAGSTAVVAAAAAAGLATLAKGPLGVLLPGLVVGGFLLTTRELRPLRELVGPRALVAFAVVAAPWYVAILRDQGEHFVSVFLAEPQPPALLVHGPQPPGAALVLPAGAARSASFRGRVSRSPASCGGAARVARDRFLVLWLVLPLAFFSLAGPKLPGYILPCVPPLAILVGRAADRLVSEGATAERSLSARVVGLVDARAGRARGRGGPAGLFHEQEPQWRSVIPLGVWALVGHLPVLPPRRRRRRRCARTLRVGAAGLHRLDRPRRTADTGAP